MGDVAPVRLLLIASMLVTSTYAFLSCVKLLAVRKLQGMHVG